MPGTTPDVDEDDGRRRTPDIAPTAPTERSKPPTMIMSSIPQATIPMIEFCWRMLMRFWGSRKLSLAMTRMATTMAKMAAMPYRDRNSVRVIRRRPAGGRLSAARSMPAAARPTGVVVRRHGSSRWGFAKGRSPGSAAAR